jgi:molybdopterin-guanine dinucleotide biosynthesis protein A
VALWPRRLAGELRAAILDGERRVGAWAAQHGVTTVEWEGDPFLNVNTPEELAAAERLLRQPPLA